MEVIFSYYEIVTTVLLLVWLLIFILEPMLRREMLILSILSVVILPLAFSVSGNPIDEVTQQFQFLTVTDIFFAFGIAGIAGTVFHAVFGKHYHPLPKLKSKKTEQGDNISQVWLMRLIITFLAFVWGIVLLAFFFNLTVAASVFVSALVLATYMVSHRHDLLMDAIWSAVLTALVVFLASNIATSFVGVDLEIPPITSSALFFGAPVDLLLWSLALGVGLGPIYEYMRRFELKR